MIDIKIIYNDITVLKEFFLVLTTLLKFNIK